MYLMILELRHNYYHCVQYILITIFIIIKLKRLTFFNLLIASSPWKIRSNRLVLQGNNVARTLQINVLKLKH